MQQRRCPATVPAGAGAAPRADIDEPVRVGSRPRGKRGNRGGAAAPAPAAPAGGVLERSASRLSLRASTTTTRGAAALGLSLLFVWQILLAPLVVVGRIPAFRESLLATSHAVPVDAVLPEKKMDGGGAERRRGTEEGSPPRVEIHVDRSKVPAFAFAPMKPHEMLLPVPVIVMGMPKAGTTSIGLYFRCGFGKGLMHRVSHYDCHENARPFENQTEGAQRACGRVMVNNLMNEEVPIFDKIDIFDVYSEIDAIYKESIVFPQVRFITQIYEAYPNATWVLNLRNPEKWVESLNRVGLRQKIIASGVSNRRYGEIKAFGVGETDQEMYDFYHAQANFVRNFAKDHPSIHLVEVTVDEPNAGEVLERSFGIRKDCWGQRNAGRTS